MKRGLSAKPPRRAAGARGPARALRAAVRGEEGYNLVFLMVLVTVMNIFFAAALPNWTAFMKREKEAELIFRGMQYAEAIRVFQQRHGRLPIRLEELVEVEPRSIRQLYPEPLSEHGKWGLLIQGARPAQATPATPQEGETGTPSDPPPASPPPSSGGGTAAVGAPQGIPRGIGLPGAGSGTMTPVPPSGDDEFGRPTQQTTGPIVGVYSAVNEESLRVFVGQTRYSDWHFHIGLIPTPVMLGGEQPAPRVHSNWVGKPFRSDLQVQTPGAPSAGQDRGRDLTEQDRRGSNRRPGRRSRGF